MLTSNAKTSEEFRENVLELLAQRIGVEEAYANRAKTQTDREIYRRVILALRGFQATIREIKIL